MEEILAAIVIGWQGWLSLKVISVAKEVAKLRTADSSRDAVCLEHQAWLARLEIGQGEIHTKINTIATDTAEIKGLVIGLAHNSKESTS